MPKFRIKSGDQVVVTAGKHKGSTGRVTKVLTKNSRVVVEGVNVRKRHRKAGPSGQGGIVTIEAPIHISNVAFWDGEKRVKIGYRLEDGKKVRFDKKTGTVID